MIAKLEKWQQGNETSVRKLLKEAPLVAQLVNGKQVVVGTINELGGVCDHCMEYDLLDVGVQRYAKIVWVEE